MSMHTYADQVPFALQCVMGGDLERLDKWGDHDQAAFLAELEGYKEDAYGPLGLTTPARTYSFNGWEFGEEELCGKKGHAFGDTMTKEGFKVVLVNESQYSHVGYLELTVVADNEAALEEWKKDFVNVIGSGPVDIEPNCLLTVTL